jgi:uncharacterized protein DUF5753
MPASRSVGNTRAPVCRTTVRQGSPSDHLVWSSGSPWWQRYAVANAEYLSWEADAHHVQEWAVLRIPDLLCTSDYTRALLCTDAVFRAQHLVGGTLDHAGQRRLQDEIDSRRDRLDRVTGCQRDRPINEYTAIVEEAALRKVVGDSSIMRDQLLALVEYCGWSCVTVQVIPEKVCAQADTDGGFTLLEFPNPLQAPLMFAHYPGGVVVECEPSVVKQARRRFEAVRSAALPKADSTELIQQLADQLYPG